MNFIICSYLHSNTTCSFVSVLLTTCRINVVVFDNYDINAFIIKLDFEEEPTKNHSNGVVSLADRYVRDEIGSKIYDKEKIIDIYREVISKCVLSLFIIQI